MPSAPRPKQFVAAQHFSYAGRTYRAGDPVIEPRVIAHLLRRGDKYIVPVRAKPAPAEPSAEDSATPPPAESPKED